MNDFRKHFESFYNHPFIKSIASHKKWSVSDKNKRPIDIINYMTFNKISGAQTTDENSLVDLNTLCEVIPNAANHAYHMDVMIDDFVILDIEPTCPEDLRNELLKLPYIYGEYSLSGKGIHLIFPTPENFYDYPVATKKVALKEEHGWYEILLNHWVTFTRNMIEPATGDKSFEQIYAELAIEQKEVNRSEIDVDDLAPESPPKEDMILHTLFNTRSYKKTPNDFYGDYSKYEYGHMGYLNYRLKLVLDTHTVRNTKHVYTPNERAWLLYTVAREQIPHREKHRETRDGLPWLLYLAREIIAKDNLK